MESVQISTSPRLSQQDRRQSDRRIIDRRLHTAEEIKLAKLCAQAGTKFVGVQRGVPESNLPTLVLFNDDYGSTLALPVEDFNVGAVIVKAAKSNEKWRRILGGSR